MSTSTAVLRADIWEDSSVFLMARVLGHAATAITQATISSISAKVYDLDNANAETYSAAQTVASVVFDTLQTSTDDPRWTADSTGYNYAATIPASAFPTGDHAYQVEVRFTPASGDVIPLVAVIRARALIGS